MANKRSTWLGLLAILVIGLILVAHAPDVRGKPLSYADDRAPHNIGESEEPPLADAYCPLAIYPPTGLGPATGCWRLEWTNAPWTGQDILVRPSDSSQVSPETDEPELLQAQGSVPTAPVQDGPVCMLGRPEERSDPASAKTVRNVEVAAGESDRTPNAGYQPLALGSMRSPAGQAVAWSRPSVDDVLTRPHVGVMPVAQQKGGDEKKEPTPAPKQTKQPEATQPTQPQTPETQTPQTQPTQQPTSLENFYGLPSVAGGAAPSTAAAAAAPAAAATNISGQTAVPASGVGDLLATSNSAQGVDVQRRSPLVGDPRIEGMHFGQIYTQADGGYWFPARVDLDTVVSKLNSSDIQNILIIRGPFSVRYGPAFSFMDIESLPTPRSTQGCFDAHGSTSFNYRTNGQGVQGQQSFWGGNTDWGFRLTYDINAAGDYVSGNGTKLPSSYNNQFANFAFGFNLSQQESVEFRYLHVQQREVLIPGLLTDINSLATDAFTARYSAKEGTWFDKLTLDAWINSTSFNGDSSNPQTRAQIPALDNIFPANLSPQNALLDATFGPVRLDINTNGTALSYGGREIVTWGDIKSFNISAGADIRVFTNNYNEFDAFNLSVLPGTGLPANLGIPNARLVDGGAFLDAAMPVGDRLLVKAGVRGDFVSMDFLNFGTNFNTTDYMTSVGDPIDRRMFQFSGFATGEYKIAPEWTAQLGYGYAQRPPTLTELYVGGSFLGLIQNGLNSVYGNPELNREQIHQGTVGLTGTYDAVRVGGSAFYAFLPSYITYDNLGPFTVSNITISGLPPLTGTTPINRLRFINTQLATLYGFDAYGEWDALPWLTPFATLSFVEGWDQTRNEALPGIPPLSSRAGLRFHEPGKTPRWGVEYTARMVATQDLFAASLGEQRTGGFVVHNLRAYWQPRREILILAGVENIGNLQYREHLDLRTGFGVYQPGINFYVGTKVTY
jgi:outer membrane receptor protein involved in Fe transport